jgi:hypothetical protein
MIDYQGMQFLVERMSVATASGAFREAGVDEDG